MFTQKYNNSFSFNTATTYQTLNYTIEVYPETFLDIYYENKNIGPADRISYKGISFDLHNDDEYIYIYNHEKETFLQYDEFPIDFRPKIEVTFVYSAKGYTNTLIGDVKNDLLVYITINPNGKLKISGQDFEKYYKLKIKKNKKFMY